MLDQVIREIEDSLNEIEIRLGVLNDDLEDVGGVDSALEKEMKTLDKARKALNKCLKSVNYHARRIA